MKALTISSSLVLPSALALCSMSCQSAATDEPIAPWMCTPRVDLSSIWEHVSERHDANHDGRVTAAEYGRGEVRFANYDLNEDGVLEASDFPTDSYFNGFSHMMLEQADADADGEVSRQEWGDFSSAMDVNGDGRVRKSEVQEVMGRWTDDWRIFLLSFDQDSDGDFDEVDLNLTFGDQDYNGDGVLAGKELSGWQPTIDRPKVEAPAVGDEAPDFTLRYADSPHRKFSLSGQSELPTGARPTALIFGSYT